MAEGKTQKSTCKKLLELKIGESIPFPIQRINSIRVSCCNLGLQYGLIFSTIINREDRTISVKRIR